MILLFFKNLIDLIHCFHLELDGLLGMTRNILYNWFELFCLLLAVQIL